MKLRQMRLNAQNNVQRRAHASRQAVVIVRILGAPTGYISPQPRDQRNRRRLHAPSRFCALKQTSNSKVRRPSIGSRPLKARRFLLTASPTFAPFDHSKDACAGRFFAVQQSKCSSRSSSRLRCQAATRAGQVE